MATVTPTRRRRSATSKVQLPTRVRRPARPTPSREERLADARAREAHARRELAQAFARMEQTYALAVRNLEELDAYLNGVRQRLQKAGYLVPSRERGYAVQQRRVTAPRARATGAASMATARSVPNRGL